MKEPVFAFIERKRLLLNSDRFEVYMCSSLESLAELGIMGEEGCEIRQLEMPWYEVFKKVIESGHMNWMQLDVGLNSYFVQNARVVKIYGSRSANPFENSEKIRLSLEV